MWIAVELFDEPVSVGMLEQAAVALGHAYGFGCPPEIQRADKLAPDLDPPLVRIWLDVPPTPGAYQLLLDALTMINVRARQLMTFPSTYGGAVHYEKEPPGLEVWATTPALYARKHGDCDDLALDRAGELVAAGHEARAFAELQHKDGERDYYHVMVRTPWGVEDPSRPLGMSPMEAV